MKKSLLPIALSVLLIPLSVAYSSSIATALPSQILASSIPSSLNQKQQLIVQAANLEVMEATESSLYRQDSPRIQYIKSQQRIVAQKLRKIDPTDHSKQIRLVRNQIVKQEINSLEKQIKTRSLKFSKNSPQIMVLKDQIANLRKLIS